MPRFERHPSPSLSHTVPPVSVCVYRWQLAEGRKKKDQKKKKWQSLGSSEKKERSAPVTGVSLSASQGLGVPPPTKCLCPKWTARDCPVGPSIDVGVATRDWPISALRCSTPHPCSRAKSCRVAPRPNRRPPLMPVWLNATFLALANARGEFRRKEGICFLAPPQGRVVRGET